MTNVLYPEFDRLRRISLEIRTVLDEFHRELQLLGQTLDDNPYEEILAALKKERAIDYDIVWNEDGRTVKTVRVRAIGELGNNT